MKYIVKNIQNEPQSLRDFRNTPNATYSGFGDTGQLLKRALCNEQGYICCYCLQRIEPTTTTVEHYITQNRHEESPFTKEIHKSNGLNYLNMLGSCNTKTRNCSSIRRNTPLSINPQMEQIEAQIGFRNDGTIYAINENESVKNQLELLKLGTFHNPRPINGEHWLISNRAVIIDKIREKFAKVGWSKTTIQAEINSWRSTDGTGYFEPYCQTAIFYLQKKLKHYN